VVTGVGVADGQIKEARLRCEALGLAADFRVAPAEDTGLPAASWDVVTASQAWLSFDTERVIAEVKRLLKPDGLLVTSHLCWLPREDSVAQASERLFLQHNARWAGADLSGEVPFLPQWSPGQFRLQAMFVFDEAWLRRLTGNTIRC
jgi:SAM-dependent methyltransferase